MRRNIVQAGIAVLVAMVLWLSGCAALPVGHLAEQARFDELLRRQFIATVTSDSLTLNHTLKDPSAWGITDVEPTLPSFDPLTEAEIQEVRDEIAELYAIDRDALTRTQQRDYDVLTYLAELFEPSLEFYLLKDPLVVDLFHIQLPLMLHHFPMAGPADVETYLALLAQFGESFASLERYARTSAKQGRFMSDMQADAVIDDCEHFISDRAGNVLVAGFEELLEGLSLDDASRQAYIAENRRLFDTVVVPAYESLIAVLESLKGSAGSVTPDMRQAFYTHELKTLGITRSPDDWIAIADDQLQSVFARRAALRAQLGEDDANSTRALLERETPEATIRCWLDNAFHEFPDLPHGVNVDVGAIPESLSSLFGAAYIMIPKLDDYQSNVIRFGVDYVEKVPSDFLPLIAHEAYPGHMLQLTTLMAGPLSDFRKITFFLAHVEGWAEYAEQYSYRYIDADPALKELYQLRAPLNVMLGFRIELGVNYQGWDLQQVSDYLTENVAPWYDVTPGFVEGLHYQAHTRPFWYAPYATGRYELLQLRVDFEAASAFHTHRHFHDQVLGLGPAPFSLLRQWMHLTNP